MRQVPHLWPEFRIMETTMKTLRTILVASILLGALGLPAASFAQPQNRDDRAAAQRAREEHPVIEDSIRQLQAVRDELEHKAASDFKGHKAAAIRSIDEAIAHLREALRVDTK
jgi:hypothetical protein